MGGLIKALSGSLVAALGQTALPVTEQQTRRIPALGAVRIAADGDGLSVTAASFDGTITTSLEAAAEGEMAVPLERLANLVRHFPADAELTIAADDHAATIAAGRSRFKLPIFPINELLDPHTLGEETGRVELEAGTARDLFARPAFAASTEPSRFYFNGILLHNVGDDLVAVASDGIRLCRVTVPATGTLSTDRELIVPNEMVKAIDRLLGASTGLVTLRRSERLFAVEGPGFTLVTKRIDATFPEYERLISFEAPNVVTIARARLRQSLARFAAVADPQTKTHVVGLCWNADGLHLSASDGSEDLLPADVEGEAKTAVQARYLADLIGGLRGDNVRLSAGGPGSMILVTNPDDPKLLIVQMPMRSS